MTSTGSRFADLLPDETGEFTDYVPRHLRAVALSPELQEALDRAFAPEPEAVVKPDEPSPGLRRQWIGDPQPTPQPSAEPTEAMASPQRSAEPVDVPADQLVDLPADGPVEIEVTPVFTTPTPATPELSLVPPVASSPSSPSFPDPAGYRKGSFGPDPALSAGIMGRFFRQKVDPARLIVRTV
jgi:hypothetical protein